MAIIDIIILIVFAVAVIAGFRKGFIVQIGSFAAILTAIIACRLFGAQVTELMLAHCEGEPSVWQRYSASAMAYCGVYIIAYYAVVLVARLCRKAVGVLMLGPLDSIGGALLSVFKWFMALSVAANLYIALFPGGNWLATSRLCGGKAV
ncbi:MAG: CvpA family protein, partial [Duncaniella sp.]|nr:CvpA family protein [Duncaniella sp.]